ncbi:MAG TPA: MAPEG family protein [Legionella sp.]|nr:MAPEG family protein [Legionella sp.]
MYTLILCLFIAVLLPYLAKLPVGYAMQKTGRYDNNHPRAQQASLTGFGGRAVAAHHNSFESLIVFATAALTALVTNNLSDTIQMLAVTYIVARVIYHVLYLLNWSTLRSTIWFVSYASCLAILWMCIP